MKRNTILKVLNPVLGVLLVNQIATGFFREALSREAFELLHEGGGVLLAVAAALHLILNWNWVQASFFRKQATGP